MDVFENYLQHAWATNQVLAEQYFHDKEVKNAAYYAGRAAMVREVLEQMGLKTNEDIYVKHKLGFKERLEKNQVKGK